MWKDILMKPFRTSLLYVVGGCLKNPKPSNMFSKLCTIINYIIHTIFMNFEGSIVHFYYTS